MIPGFVSFALALTVFVSLGYLWAATRRFVGPSPRQPDERPTPLTLLKDSYASGKIDLPTLEARSWMLFAEGRADRPGVTVSYPSNEYCYAYASRAISGDPMGGLHEHLHLTGGCGCTVAFLPTNDHQLFGSESAVLLNGVGQVVATYPETA